MNKKIMQKIIHINYLKLIIHNFIDLLFYIGNYILFRCCNFHIDSILQPIEIKNINYNEIEEREKIIDIYNLNLKKLCASTLDNINGELDELLYVKGLNLIKYVSFDLYANLLFSIKNIFEKFKIGVNVGKYRINTRDGQTSFIELIITIHF